MRGFKFSKAFEDYVPNAPVRVTVFGKTDLGRTRDHNEDTFLVVDLTTGNASLQPEVRDHAVGERGSLFMVADGMGGAAAGEIASAMAADVILTHLKETWIHDQEPTSQRFAFRLKEAVEHANTRINQHSKEHPEVRGMGTTVTVAGILGNELYLAQVGDSRAYLIRNGGAIQLTKDQSLMQRLVEAGELTEEEAEQSERRNIILQALGPEARVKVDLTYQPLSKGDTVVLCSDGLSGQVKKEEIAELVNQQPDLVALCSRLIDIANSRGGPDNITAVVARFDGAGLLDPRTSGEAGYQVYPLHEGDATTQPVPIYTGSPAPVSRKHQQRLMLIAIASAVLAIAAFLLLR
ncbi:MAG: Stp1/IreP family PP2C-type Ser/Thr phosphatase [Gemmatimonadota bacterium]